MSPRQLRTRYIASRLKSYLIEEGMTQRTLAEELGMQTQNLNAIINGRLVVGQEIAERISNHLNKPVEELFQNIPVVQ